MHEPNKAFQIQGVYVLGVYGWGGMCPRGYMSRGSYPGGSCPGGYMSGGKCPGGSCPGGFCPVTI